MTNSHNLLYGARNPQKVGWCGADGVVGVVVDGVAVDGVVADRGLRVGRSGVEGWFSPQSRVCGRDWD